MAGLVIFLFLLPPRRHPRPPVPSPEAATSNGVLSSSAPRPWPPRPSRSRAATTSPRAPPPPPPPPFAARASRSGAPRLACADMDDDGVYIRWCVELARKAAGHTSPNPMVGCVVVRGGRVVGEGFHPEAGQPHAEVFALRDARDLAENATAYVSLEPCNHYGRTPPCTEALINAKLKDVVVGMTDPNPIVASKGIERLQSAGIDVRVCMEEEALCRNLNEAYIHCMLTGKAFATLRTTLSVNGVVVNQIGTGADQPGGYYSQLLKEYDGVIISGISVNMTTLPTSHEAGAKQPLYIIIAQGGNSQLNIQFLREECASEAVVLTDSPVTVKPPGVEVLVLDRMSLEFILEILAQRGLCSVLVDFREAGGDFAYLLKNFQEEKLVQKVVVELLPIWTVTKASKGRS
ncbi:Os04g0177400 [Oryza sativa Japonica Group]|uniref:Riboflavin biosynthesis protein PYRD, chloroplastic n=1 Tax=Oryza sativa subsp. japonica TaxID=39947 RepID=B7E8M5_ORYSJ|nr:riboflavin biosynthesis protein PYRD, chloroplastic [Oryza sativa Japonica Group]KAB8094862.1 hypothetical protein EE612_022272 [Oryza sativa]KAF2932835.1 hypothetical protein DAI22_04g029800 [Oryza sativa Japonica Group]BAG88722.1 unnamed protein product [Oryza sativa Japonica Group]BAS87942.1 Os04g0177400 [Oryza sativa Japonica Group]